MLGAENETHMDAGTGAYEQVWDADKQIHQNKTKSEEMLRQSAPLFM